MAKKKTAGAFDIRNVIGLLLAIYGVLLAGAGLVGDQAYEKTGGVNANLIAGISLFVVGAAFLLWAKLRPVVVPDEHLEAVEGDHRD